jgi:hypothetical protein
VSLSAVRREDVTAFLSAARSAAQSAEPAVDVATSVANSLAAINGSSSVDQALDNIKNNAQDDGRLTADYFPLNTGDRYTYRRTKLNNPTDVRTGEWLIRAPVDLGGVQATPIDELENGSPHGRIFFQTDRSAGLGIVREEHQNGEILNFSPPALFATIGLLPGQESTPRTVQVSGNTPVKTETVSATYVARETVTVPAGTFNNVAHLHIRFVGKDANGNIIDDGGPHVWLARGIGLVEELDSATDGNHDELTSAQVGGQNIP